MLARPQLAAPSLDAVVGTVLAAIRQEGDAAVRRYTAQFDGVDLADFRVSAAEQASAATALTPALRAAIQTAKHNIAAFHRQQEMPVQIVETMPGVQCWRKNVPIDKVGLYIPGGTAPLFSTVLMLGVPAQLAGCAEVVLCSPPRTDGTIHPAILYAAQLVGIQKIFKVGGVQAIGAMAYGTASVPAVYKIFGPGNQYVTAAKQLVSREQVAIDMPAGPSEVLVCADEGAPAGYVAADLLSQAEHGADSQVVLVAFSEAKVEAVQAAIAEQLAQLPRQALAQRALENSVAVVLPDQKSAVALINAYAPEHLILALADPLPLAEHITNAGSVFLGYYTPEAVGDYASGTNHTLPTNGYARAYSGVSLDSFVKKITFQQLSWAGLQNLGPTVEEMALAEQLTAHQQAVRLRLDAPLKQI